jgi:hypothetical protein
MKWRRTRHHVQTGLQAQQEHTNDPRIFASYFQLNSPRRRQLQVIDFGFDPPAVA